MSFSGDVQPIFDANCTGCHGSGVQLGGLNLAPGQSFAQLVNVTSIECAATLRIQPFAPASSYLVQKITGTTTTCGPSTRMPLGGTPLSASDQAKIGAWIAAGALDD